MQRKFAICLRLYIGICALVLFWSVWRAAAGAGARVELTEPAAGSRFNPGTNILMQAAVPTEVGPLRHVEFVRNGQVVGIVSNAPYSFVWTNTRAGSYELLARAVPAAGDPVESGIVRVQVYSTLLTFGLHRVAFLENYKLFQIPLWQYIAALIYVFLAFYISKFLDYLTRVWLKKWADRTSTRFDDLLLQLLNGPVRVIAFVIFLRIGIEMFSWPALFQTLFAKGFTVVVAVTLTYVVLKFIDLLMSYWRERTKGETDKTFDEQLFPIIRKSLKLFVVVVATLVTLDNLDVNITAAIASLSIGGLAVGLAAQDTLANMFGAVAVFLDKPFRIGDRIKLDAVDGVVESIGMRSTRVRNLDGHLITIPNKTMGNATITNITLRPNIKTVINLGITYDTPVAKVNRALAILHEVYRSHTRTGDVWVNFSQFGDSALNLQVVHWWNANDYKEYLDGMQELNLKIKEQFDREGINFAFPSRTLYVKQDSEWRVGPRGDAADPAGQDRG